MKILSKSRKNLIFIGIFMFFVGFIFLAVNGNATGEPSFNADKQKKQKPKVGRLSDIKVVNMRLNSKCQITFRLQNKGKYKMTALEHSKGAVRVYFGKKHMDFFLTKQTMKGKAAVDPGKVLRSPGGNVHYNTRILLKKQERVAVVLTYIKKLSNLNSSRLHFITLIPTCKVAGPQKEEKPGAKTGMKQTGMRMRRGAAKGPATLVYPNGGEHIEGTCDAIGLKWNYYGDIANIPTTWNIQLRRGGALERQTTLTCEHYTDHTGYRECRATFVHSCVPEGDYKAHISGTERDGTVLTDESDNTFHIGITGGWATIVFTSPIAGQRCSPGEDLLIKWWSTGPITPAVAIMRGGVAVLPVPLGGRVSVDAHGKSFKTVRIPDDFPVADDYSVKVTNSANPANSQVSGLFSIRPYAPDFEFISSPYVRDGNHLGVQIMARREPRDPEFAGPVTFRIVKGEYNRSTSRWLRRENWTVTLRRVTSPGTGHFDLGDMRATRDFPCGIHYQVTVDSPNDYFERDETNNVSRVVTLFNREDYGTINCYETTGSLGFNIKINNCGRSEARGNVRIRQVGYWRVGHRLGDTLNDVQIYEQHWDLISGGVLTIKSIWDSMSFRSVPSTIYIHFGGDFASWTSRNPVVLRIGETR